MKFPQQKLTLGKHKKSLCRVRFFGREWELSKTLLPSMPTRPMLFVYPHEHNPWAADLITRFRADLSAWYDEDTMPLFDCIAARGDRSELHTQLQNHFYISGLPDREASHIITIGDWCSQEVARFRQGRRLTHIAQIFCAQSNPQNLDLSDDEGNLIANTNGVYATPVNSYHRQIRSLKSIRQNVHRVAVVFDPNGAYDCLHDQLHYSANLISSECQDQGLEVVSHYLSIGDNVARALKPLAGTVDAIITLRDNTAYAHMDDIVEFAGRHGITVLSSELSSVFRGAAIGFGNAPASYVPAMIRLIVQQELTEAPPLEHQLPEAILEEERMAHNRAALAHQGIILSPQQEDLLDMISVHLVDA